MAIKNRNLLESFNRAASGIIYCLRTQRNFRIHVFAAGAVLLLSLWFRLSKWEFLLVLAAIFLVLITEAINTAVEVTIDRSPIVTTHWRLQPRTWLPGL